MFMTDEVIFFMIALQNTHRISVSSHSAANQSLMYVQQMNTRWSQTFYSAILDFQSKPWNNITIMGEFIYYGIRNASVFSKRKESGLYSNVYWVSK